MFRSIKDEDLKIILKWRNHPNVRQMMFTDHVISWDEHLLWWRKVKKDDSQLWLMFQKDGESLGVVNFLGIGNETVDWGFYLSDQLYGDIRQIFIWSSLEKEAIKYAFSKLNSHKLIAQVFDFNKTVRKMHERFGFEYIGSETKEKNGCEEKVWTMQLAAEDYIDKK